MISLCFLSFSGGIAFSQEQSPRPELETAYHNHFYQEDASFASKCFENALLDKKGRLWLIPCAIHVELNALGILHFDGYRFIPLNVRNAEGAVQNITVFSGISSSGQLFGLAGSRRNLFFADPDSRTTRLVDLVDLVDLAPWIPNNIIEAGPDLFFISANHLDKDSVGLFSLQNGQLKKEVAIAKPITDAREYRAWVFFNTPQDVWFMSPFLPLHRYDKVHRKFYTYHAEDFPGEITPTTTFLNYERLMPSIVNDGSNGILLYLPRHYDDRLYRFDPDKAQFYSMEEEFPASWIPKGLHQDQVGNICFVFQDTAGTYRAILQDTSGRRYDYSEVLEGIGNIRKLESRDFFQQVFAVGNEGLHLVSIREKLLFQEALPDKWVSSMIQLPNDRILVNTVTEGWYTVDPDDGSAVPFSLPDCGIDPFPFDSAMKQQIQQDAVGNFWFLSGKQLVRYDPLIQKCTGFDLDDRYSLFCFTDENTVALSTRFNRLAFYDLTTRSFRSFGPGVPRQIPAKIRDFLVDSRGLLWIPTNQGLWKMDLQEQTSEIVELDTDLRFAAIYENEDGKIWLGSYFDGIVIYDPVTATTQVVNQRQGLSNNSVMSIIADDAGYLWAATEYGITVLAPDGTVISELHEEDGLNYEVFERFDPYKDRRGRLYFGTREGINIIDPDEFKAGIEQSAAPHIYLTEMSFYDRQAAKMITQLNGLEQPPDLSLPANHRYLRLNFALTSYVQPQRNRYAYRLEGIHEDWIFLGAQPELILNQLPVGKYRLLIKGADHRNNWSETPLAINIHARDFFYRESWFYLSLFGLFGTVAFFWIRRLRFEKERLEAEVQKRTHRIRQDKEVIEQQAAALQELDKLKSRFFTNISHELRTPITLITAPVEQLLRKSAEQLGHGTRQSLQIVLKNGRKLLQLVEELLDLSRLEANKIQLDETATHPGRHCRQIFRRFVPAAEAAGIEFDFIDEWPAEENPAWLDQARLEKILSNLLSNAFKFTPPGGSVALRLHKESDHIRIQVQDTGRGISSEDLPYIFERYFQTRHTETADEGGAGIGLALAGELTRMMQGTLEVESEWGHGSHFTLYLPFRPVEAADHVVEEVSVKSTMPEQLPAADTPQVLLNTVKNNGKSAQVLIVEDNTDMQTLLSDLLAEDYHCLLAGNGREALAILDDPASKQLPALIISDIMMPKMDGYALLRYLKDQPALRQIPVVMLTSKTGETDKLQALRMGVDDYLTKPFTPEELQLRVHRLIVNSRRRTAFLQSDQVAEDPPPDTDQSWLQELETAAIKALDQQLGLSKSYLAHEMDLSDRQLLRRLKSLTGMTIHQYILEIKLQRARYLLEKQAYPTLAEIARACGFNSAGYFSKVYEKHFGRRPETR